jgi:hypothetical protein
LLWETLLRYLLLTFSGSEEKVDYILFKKVPPPALFNALQASLDPVGNNG